MTNLAGTSLLTMKELKLSVDDIERIADNLVDNKQLHG